MIGSAYVTDALVSYSTPIPRSLTMAAFIPHAPLPRAPSRHAACTLCMRRRTDAMGVPYIRLEAFLKKEGMAETGGRAKLTIIEGEVCVNGTVETRRGRKLREGDVVSVFNSDDIAVHLEEDIEDCE